MKPDRATLASEFRRADGAPVRWKHIDGQQPYRATLERMEALAGRVAAGAAEEVWLLEHPPLYTAGTSAKVTDLVKPDALPVHRTGRGGEYTYHGPGQRVAYAMLDLKARRADIRAYVAALEDWIIAALDAVNVRGERREDRVGVWVRRPERGGEDKIAAIGIRVRRWVAFHGIAVNVEPDLAHYDGIVPCGIRGHGITSLVDLGLPITMEEFDPVLREAFEAVFGPTVSG